MPFDENAYQRVSCTSDTPVIRLSQEQKQLVSFTVRDEDGVALDLNTLVEPPGDGSSSSSDAQATLVVRMAVSQCLSSSSNEFLLDGEIVDAETGAVTFQLLPEHTVKPGVFTASIGVFSNDILKHQSMAYLEFMATNFNLNTGGPISVPEVRMHIMDMCPDANYLLDELEFTDAEIIHAMRYAVDYFNEANPPVGGYSYDAFPFRAKWLDGASAQLLKMISHRYRRNALSYSAGGVTVADQEKYTEYEAAARREWSEYTQWVEAKKVAINISLGYGRIGPSPYGRVHRS